MPLVKSVRLQILEAVQDRYANLVEPDWPGGPLKFSLVEVGHLNEFDSRKRSAIGIVAGPEKERFTFPFIECNWQLGIEFRYTVNKGETVPGIVAENLLTVVKSAIDIDRSWGKLAVDTKRTGSEIDLTTYGDKSIAGVLFIDVMFRHSHFDVRDRQPDP